ncbi:MAG: hypothetical protein ACM31P_14735 [Actinomycetota bacterium]
MKKQNQTRPCGACLQPGNPVITEAFVDNGSAFKRHAQLVAAGCAPSLCMRRDGTRYVCHLGGQAA